MGKISSWSGFPTELVSPDVKTGQETCLAGMERYGRRNLNGRVDGLNTAKTAVMRAAKYHAI